MEQRYGQVGMIWLNASLANDLLVVIPSVAGFVTVFADPTRTSRISLYLLAAAFLFVALSVVRGLQASSAGQKFRRADVDSSGAGPQSH